MVVDAAFEPMDDTYPAAPVVVAAIVPMVAAAAPLDVDAEAAPMDVDPAAAPMGEVAALMGADLRKAIVARDEDMAALGIPPFPPEVDQVARASQLQLCPSAAATACYQHKQFSPDLKTWRNHAMMTLIEVEVARTGGGMSEDHLRLFRRRMVEREPPYPWAKPGRLIVHMKPADFRAWANIDSLWREALGEWVYMCPVRTVFNDWISDEDASLRLESLSLDRQDLRKRGTFHTLSASAQQAYTTVESLNHLQSCLPRTVRWLSGRTLTSLLPVAFRNFPR